MGAWAAAARIRSERDHGEAGVIGIGPRRFASKLLARDHWAATFRMRPVHSASRSDSFALSLAPLRRDMIRIRFALVPSTPPACASTDRGQIQQESAQAQKRKHKQAQASTRKSRDRRAFVR